MQRGDVVIVSLPGEYGKPRPAVVIQESRLLEHFESITIAPITSIVTGGSHIRVAVEPTEENGLRKTSRIMADKIQTAQRHRVGELIGKLDAVTMAKLDDAIRTFLGLRYDIDEEDTP